MSTIRHTFTLRRLEQASVLASEVCVLITRLFAMIQGLSCEARVLGGANYPAIIDARKGWHMPHT